MISRPRTPPSSLRGFSMVEALVALVVLGVGMLGIASLYVVTLRSSGSAMSRMQAVNLASDIGDRIRANRMAREAYEGAAATDERRCYDTVCTAAELAAHDLWWWQQQIEATLPGDPEGTIEVEGAGDLRTYVITLSWVEPGQPDELSYTMRMQI